MISIPQQVQSRVCGRILKRCLHEWALGLGWFQSGLRERSKLGLKSRLYFLHRRVSASQTCIRMLKHIVPSSQQLEISVDPLTHQIRLIHPQFILSEQQSSPGDSTPSTGLQNFIHDRLTILTLILFIFVVELIFLGWFYGPSAWQYFRKQKAKGSMFTRKPQRRVETRRTPLPDLEVETVVG